MHQGNSNFAAGGDGGLARSVAEEMEQARESARVWLLKLVGVLRSLGLTAEP